PRRWSWRSLSPREGWRGAGVSPFAYLTAPWPRRIFYFDVAVNVLGYIPYGFLAATALQPRLRGRAALLAATDAAAGLPLGLEALQSYLRARVASNLDSICNVLGAAIGAAAAVRYAPRLLEEGAFARLRQSAFLQGGG